jgi:hypothetical protein
MMCKNLDIITLSHVYGVESAFLFIDPNLGVRRRTRRKVPMNVGSNIRAVEFKLSCGYIQDTEPCSQI